MAYQTGSFTSPADLIATIKAFASANGWTVSGDVVYKGTIFTALTVETVTPDDMVKIQGGTGQSGGSLTGAANGSAYCLGSKYLDRYAVQTFSWAFSGTYYLFLDSAPDSIVCVMRSNEGLYYNWLTFGALTKYGVHNGGEYFGASYSTTTQQRVPQISSSYQADGFFYGRETLAPLWLIGRSAQPGSPNFLIRSDLGAETWLGEAGVGVNGCSTSVGIKSLIERMPNTWNGQTALIPCWVFAPRPSNFNSLIGLFTPARMIRVDNYEAGDIITLGADKYKVFPFFKKDSDNRDGNISISNDTGVGISGTFGWAIKYDGP